MTSVKVIVRKTKGGPGSGNWGHAGIPGHRGGSAPSGHGTAGPPPPTSKPTSPMQAAKSYVEGLRKVDKGIKTTSYEDDMLRNNGFSKVDGTDVYIMEPKSLKYGGNSFALVSKHKSSTASGEISYIATYFNADKRGNFLESSEHGYAKHASNLQSVQDIIGQVNKYYGQNPLSYMGKSD